MNFAILLRLVEPLAAIVLFLLVSTSSVFAQGNFNGDPTTVGRGLVAAFRWFYRLVFVLGFFSFGWAGINLVFSKPWGAKAMAGALCWGFSALGSLIYNFSQGQEVEFDIDDVTPR